MQRIYFDAETADQARQYLACRKEDVFSQAQKTIQRCRIPNAEYGPKLLILSEEEVGQGVNRIAVSFMSRPYGDLLTLVEGPLSLSALAKADSSPFSTRMRNRTKFNANQKSILDYESDDFRELFKFFMYGRGTVAQTVIFRAMLETTGRFAALRAQIEREAKESRPSEPKPESAPAVLSKVCRLFDVPAFAAEWSVLVKKYDAVRQPLPTKRLKAGGETTKRNRRYAHPADQKKAESMLAELAYIGQEKLAPPYDLFTALGCVNAANMNRWLSGKATPSLSFIAAWNKSALRKRLMPQLSGKVRHLGR